MTLLHPRAILELSGDNTVVPYAFVSAPALNVTKVLATPLVLTRLLLVVEEDIVTESGSSMRVSVEFRHKQTAGKLLSGELELHTSLSKDVRQKPTR